MRKESDKKVGNFAAEINDLEANWDKSERSSITRWKGKVTNETQRNKKEEEEEEKKETWEAEEEKDVEKPSAANKQASSDTKSSLFNAAIVMGT